MKNLNQQAVLATLCYLQQDGCTLMLHRNKSENDVHSGKWNGLGGKFERGETPEECVAREIHEESGVKLISQQLHGVLTFPDFTQNRDWYVFVFTSTDFSGRAVEHGPEGELQWIPDEQLLKLNLWDSDRYFLNWLKQPAFFSGKFFYHDGQLLDHQYQFYSFK